MSKTTKRPGRKNKVILPDDCPNQARLLRLAKNMTLSEVALIVKCLPHTLAQFETEGTGLGKHKQIKLADVLEITLGTLLEPGKNFAENIRQMPD